MYVAHAGSAQPRLSTNPIAFGVPTYDVLPFPLVLDIATSQTAHGKVREYAASDDTIPSNWLVDSDGTSLRDASAFIDGDDGAILPLDGSTTGHKGFELSVIMELFASILSDSAISGVDGDTWGNRAVFVAIDPTLHTTRDGVEDRVETFTSYLRNTDYSAPVNPGDAASGDRGLLPGEAEHRTLETFPRRGRFHRRHRRRPAPRTRRRIRPLGRRPGCVRRLNPGAATRDTPTLTSPVFELRS